MCNNAPNAVFRENENGRRYEGIQRDPDTVTVMANCGMMASGIEKFLILSDYPNPTVASRSRIRLTGIKRRLTFEEIHRPLRRLFVTGEMYQPPGRFHEYNVTHHSSGVTRTEFLWSTRHDAPAIARHHRRVSSMRRQSMHEPLCHGIRDGRLANLIRVPLPSKSRAGVLKNAPTVRGNIERGPRIRGRRN